MLKTGYTDGAIREIYLKREIYESPRLKRNHRCTEQRGEHGVARKSERLIKIRAPVPLFS
jgi:hypothetical protein